MNPEIILILGGISAALLGLIGIQLTQHDNTPVLELINEDELQSYRISRLVEGIGYCTLCKQEYRLTPKSSQTTCSICLPPIEIHKQEKGEAHYQPEHRDRSMNYGRSYRPLYMDWPDLFQKEGNEQ